MLQRRLILGLAAFLALYLFLRFVCQYYWYGAGETNGLFLYDTEYFLDCLHRPGGLASYLGAFLAQFFVFESGGAGIICLLCMLVYFASCAVMRKLTENETPLFGGLLVAYCILLHIDADYHLAGTISLIASLWAAIWYLDTDTPCKKSRSKDIGDWLMRLALGKWCLVLFLLPILSWLFGAAGLFTALAITITELTKNLKKGWWSLIAIATAATPLCYWCGTPGAESAELIFLPNAYYNHYLPAGFKVWYPWLVFLSMFLFGGIITRFPGTATWLKHKASKPLQIIIAAATFTALFIPAHSSITYNYLRVERWRKTEQWDKLRAMRVSEQSPALVINTYNLAHQTAAQLDQKAFIARRLGPGSLYTPYTGQPLLADLLSDIYLYQGNIAMSMKLAMNFMLSREDGLDGRALLRLIDTNLLLGHHRVAEKYIRILERTWLYRDAARDRRKFLDNKEAIAKDARLGELMKCVPREPAVVTNVVADLEAVLRANPDYKPARDFLNIYNRLIDEYKAHHE